MKCLPAIAFAAALLAGCAPPTLQGLRENPAGTTRFEVGQNYQQVYRTVIANARKCYQGSAGPMAQNVVTGDLYTDIRSGEISVALHGAAGVDTYLGIDIKALADDRTEVRTYYRPSTWASSAAGVESMLRGGSECRPR